MLSPTTVPACLANTLQAFPVSAHWAIKRLTQTQMKALPLHKPSALTKQWQSATDPSSTQLAPLHSSWMEPPLYIESEESTLSQVPSKKVTPIHMN